MKRRKLFVFFLFALCPNLMYAQNLVPNPGFEALKTTPSCWTFGSKADFDSRIENWILPNEGTSDILSTLVNAACITALPTSTYPLVDWFPRGNQFPRSGTNVVGIKPFSETRREYLEVELDCALTPGETYYCEMYVSLAEGTNYAQNLLGMYFSDTLVYVNSTNMLSFTPQVVETAVLDDTVNWVKISGNFIATAAHRYLIIGCFATAAQIQSTYIGPKSEVNFPYYYIDDVLVRMTDAPVIQWTGDTSVCLGDTLKLSVANTGNISWYNNGMLIGKGNDLVYRPESLMNLSIQVKTCQWTRVEEVDIILFSPPNVALGKDTLMCSGSTFILDGGTGYINYFWQDGNASRWYSVSSPGVYSVSVEDGNGCKGEDKIRIREYKIPSVDLGENRLTCIPEGILKVASRQPYDSYRWQDNSIKPEFHFTSEGTYWVQVKNVCGDSDSDTIEIIKIDMKIPNLITPNGDGKNETFEITGTEKGKGRLYLYNRYGAIVYSDEQYHNDWDGADLTEGVYYFLFDYPGCTPKKGWLQILR